MGPEVRTAQRPGRAARRPPRRHRVLQPRGQERPRPAAVAEPRTLGWQPGLGHRCRNGIRAEVDPEHAGTPPRGANPPASDEIGRAHVCTPVPNAPLVCRLLLEKTKKNSHNYYA